MSSIKFKQVKLIQSVKDLIRKPANLIFALILLGGTISFVGAVASPPETAAAACKAWGGRVRLSKDSKPLYIAANWSRDKNGWGLAPFMNLQANKTSCNYANFSDTDGFWVGTRCQAQNVKLDSSGKVIRIYGTWNAGWHKIDSLTRVSVRYACW